MIIVLGIGKSEARDEPDSCLGEWVRLGRSLALRECGSAGASPSRRMKRASTGRRLADFGCFRHLIEWPSCKPGHRMPPFLMCRSIPASFPRDANIHVKSGFVA